MILCNVLRVLLLNHQVAGLLGVAQRRQAADSQPDILLHQIRHLPGLLVRIAAAVAENHGNGGAGGGVAAFHRILGDNLSDRAVAVCLTALYDLEIGRNHAGVRTGLLQSLAQQAGHGVQGLPRAAEEADPEEHANARHKDRHRHDGQDDGQAAAAPLRIVVVVVLHAGRAALPGVRCGRHIGVLRGAGAVGRLGADGVGGVGAQDLGGLIPLGDQQIRRGVVKVDAGVFAELLQIRQHGVGGDIPLVHVGGHGLHGDGLQGLGDLGVDLPGREGDGVDMLDGHRHRGVPLVGQATGDHLVEHHAGRVDVAAGVDVAAPGLLGGDIVDGAQGLLGQGGLGGGGEPGDAEVGHLQAAVPQHHDVVGLDVPVDDAPAVGVGEGLHDLGDEVEGLPPGQLAPLLLHVLLEGDAVQQLHDDVVQLRRVGHVVHRHDVGVGEHGHGLGLVVEAAAELGVLGQLLLEDLDGHQPVEPVIPALVHHGHAADADALQDLISVVE